MRLRFTPTTWRVHPWLVAVVVLAAALAGLRQFVFGETPPLDNAKP